MIQTTAETTYKTVEEAREELRKINPKLLRKYRINPHDRDRGTTLSRGETSIISTEGSYGGDKGLYEILPIRDGRDFIELFGTSNRVVGWLPLEDAILIAEATMHLPKESLKVVAQKYGF